MPVPSFHTPARIFLEGNLCLLAVRWRHNKELFIIDVVVICASDLLQRQPLKFRSRMLELPNFFTFCVHGGCQVAFLQLLLDSIDILNIQLVFRLFAAVNRHISLLLPCDLLVQIFRLIQELL